MNDFLEDKLDQLRYWAEGKGHGIAYGFLGLSAAHLIFAYLWYLAVNHNPAARLGPEKLYQTIGLAFNTQAVMVSLAVVLLCSCSLWKIYKER